MESNQEEPRGVSTLELFFDLVFVFTITQLTSAFSDELSWTGLLQVSLMLGIIFCMYGGYAWLTNAIAVDRLLKREDGGRAFLKIMRGFERTAVKRDRPPRRGRRHDPPPAGQALLQEGPGSRHR